MAGEAHFRKTPWGLAIAEPKTFYLLLNRSGATRDRKTNRSRRWTSRSGLTIGSRTTAHLALAFHPSRLGVSISADSTSGSLAID
jgi:hypothetical protein